MLWTRAASKSWGTIPKPNRSRLIRLISFRKFVNKLELAIEEANAVIFVVDVTTGMTVADEQAAEILRRRQKQRDGVPYPPIFHRRE